jgi:hypothetical protein
MNPVIASIITIGVCAGGLLCIFLIDNHVKNKARARIKQLLSENWFVSDKEMEKAKKAISSVFQDTDFVFKVDWEDVQTKIITSYDVECIINKIK